MVNTPNLAVPHILADTSDVDGFNTAIDDFDLIITNVLQIAVTSNTASITAAQLEANSAFDLVEVSPGPSGNIAFTVPAQKRGAFVVINDTGFEVDVSISGQPMPAVAISAGDFAPLFSDGVNVQKDVNVGYKRFPGSVVGAPTAGATIAAAILNVPVQFATNLTGSVGQSRIAATAQTDFDIRKNGVSVGTMRWAASATVATFISTGTIDYIAGDVLTVVAPGSPDATLATLTFTLLARET